MSLLATYVGCVLLSAVGWWAGAVPGLLWSCLVVTGLAYARHRAHRRTPPGRLASMPTWQLVIVPILGALVGIAVGVTLFVLGPGF